MTHLFVGSVQLGLGWPGHALLKVVFLVVAARARRLVLPQEELDRRERHAAALIERRARCHTAQESRPCLVQFIIQPQLRCILTTQLLFLNAALSSVHSAQPKHGAGSGQRRLIGCVPDIISELPWDRVG